jgi:hypothetical protein
MNGAVQPRGNRSLAVRRDAGPRLAWARRMRTTLSTIGFAAPAFVVLAAACGSGAMTSQTTTTGTGAASSSSGESSSSGMGTGGEGGSVPYPAPHPDLPQLVNLAGGKVLTTPKVFLIFYPGYPYETQLQAMAQALGKSGYWGDTTSEYGVGAIQYAGMIELTGETPPAMIQDADIQTYLAGKITSGAFGTPDPETIYTIFYPSTTSVTLPSGILGNATSCTTFGGYHQDFTATPMGGSPTNFAYAVLPLCAGEGGMSQIDLLTGALSHEWIEASTDPFPVTNNGADSAYAQVDDDHFAWLVLGGGLEAGDLCVGEYNAFFKPMDVGFTVQRTWSNMLAKQGHDPCAPDLPGVAYFNSAPVLDTTVSLNTSITGPLTTKGVKIPVGQSKAIEVDLFSDGPTAGPWTVSATDFIAEFLGGAPSLDFKWDKTEGKNGDKLHLTVTVKTAEPIFGGGHLFVITSTLGQAKSQWAGLIVE